MGLSAFSGGRGTLANDQEKWTFGIGRVRGLVCTISVPVSFGDSSFSCGNLSPYPFSWIQQGGRVGLSSVPHGKLVVFKATFK